MSDKSTDINKLLRHVHPAEIDHLACSDLHRLSVAVGSIRRELSFLNQDLVRMTEYDKRLVLLLDFSELYAYLWPDKSSSQHKVLIRHLLTNSSLSFVLPPGAVRELIYELSRLKSEHKNVRRRVDSLLSKPLVQAFLNIYNISLSSKAAEDPQGMTGQVMTEILQALEGIRQTDAALDRLVRLYDSGRLKPLSSWVDPIGLVPEKETLNDAYFQLVSYRPNRQEVVNYVDAYNYAFAYTLNNKFYESENCFFLLVTSSPLPYRIFETIKWKEDPLFKAAPSHLMRTSLVRSPVHMLYLSFLTQDPNRKPLKLKEVMQDLAALHNTWNNLPVYRRYVRKKDIAGSTFVELPRGRDYTKRVGRFLKFYQAVYRPLAELIAADAAQEENRRRLRRVDSAGVGSIHLSGELVEEAPQDQSMPQPIINYRSVLSLFDRLLNLTDIEIARAKKSIAEFKTDQIADLDPEKLIFQPDNLEIRSQFNEKLACNEVTIYLVPHSSVRNTEAVYLCVDRYEDYASFWWRTNVDFNEFLKACRFFVKAAAHWIDTGGEKHELTLQDKEFHGVYFYLDNQVVHFPLEEVEHKLSDSPLNENLLKMCEPHWEVRFIRIGLDFGDLCYDLQPVSVFPQRAGIVTHLKCGAAISDLIQWTHVKYAQRNLIRQTIKRVFELKRTDVAAE